MKKCILGIFALTIITTTAMAQGEFSSSQIGVGVVCDDLDESLDFYLKVIGMKQVNDFDVPEAFARKSGLSDGVPFHVKVLALDESGKGNVWKLMSFGEKRKHKKSTFIQDDLGMQYITIHVSSMAPLLKRIKEHEVELLGETPVPLASDPHRQFVLIQAPEGTIIELIGPM